MSRKEKREQRQRASTRQLIGAGEITDYSLVTYGHGELVYFIVKPSNISVLSPSSVGARVYALMTVLKGVAEIEMLCLNSRESFEDNKRFLRSRMEAEENPVVRRLLEKDQATGNKALRRRRAEGQGDLCSAGNRPVRGFAGRASGIKNGYLHRQAFSFRKFRQA